MSDNRDIGYAAFFCGFGAWSFFKGFKLLREKRLIENTPTSTVRGLAMGLVELIGQAKKTKVFKAPLTGTECVFYRYTIERYESSGKSGRWVVIGKGDSNYCPFWLDDGTGKIMVFPQSAQLVMPVDYQYQTGLGKSLSDNLVYFMENNGIRYRGLLGNYQLRFMEWFILPDDSVYVLGTAQKTEDSLGDHKEKLLKRLRELKENPQKMAEVDSDHDGVISNDEWDRGLAKVEQELLEEELQSSAQENPADVVIGKGDSGQVFIISDQSQTQLIQSLSWQTFLGVFGGAALSLAMLAYLLVRLGPWIRF
jgi:hypothetical protein